MSYTVIKSFERGIDARRLLDCIEPGALLEARDCHITRGGEIEKRAAFDVVTTLPATTMGFYATEGPIFHTWGTATTAPAGMPTNGEYHSIPHPDGLTLVAIESVEEFMGQLYVVAQYEGGVFVHWWKGETGDEIVAVFISGGAVVTPDDPDADPIVIDPPPSGDPGNKPQTTVVYTFVGSGGKKITGIWLVPPGAGLALGIPLMLPTTSTGGIPAVSVSVPVGDGSGNNIAATYMGMVNSYTSTPDVTAIATGNKVTYVVEDAHAHYNGWSIQSGTININPAPYTAVLTGGVDPTPGAGTLGTWNRDGNARAGEAGTPMVLGTFALAHDQKIWTADGPKVHFSAVNNPARFDSGAFGAGDIDFRAWAEGTPNVIALADFGGDLAIFGKRHIFIEHTDPLPSLNNKKQVLHRTGTVAPHSVKSFGTGEVMYLERSGIRSLRTRASLDISYATDIGTMIDGLVTPKILAASDDDLTHHYWADIEPMSGRFWMALKDMAFVLSYYPTTSIAAWTWYDLSTHPVDMMNATDSRLFWRSGNNVICYAGLAGNVYDDTEGLVRLPYIDGGKVATSKNWNGVDMAAYGTWQVRASFDPMQPAAFDLIANLTMSTYAQQKIAMNGASPAVSLELRSTFVGPARVGNATLHYDAATAD